MADDNSIPAMQTVFPNHGALLDTLLDIKGAVTLSRQAIYNTMNPADMENHLEESAKTLQAAEGTLTMTEAAIERLYEQLEAMGKSWPASSEDVSDG